MHPIALTKVIDQSPNFGKTDLMTINEGITDRYLRIALGIVLYGLALIFGHTFGLVLGLIATIALVTGLVGFCPIYKLLGMNTCPR